MRGITKVALAVLTIVCTTAGLASAQVPTVPEIDASVIPAAVGLVSAGVFMLRARRGAK